jgi:hypothetical protein
LNIRPSEREGYRHRPRYAPVPDHSHASEESAAHAEAFAGRIDDALRRQGDPLAAGDRRELARRILELLQRRSRETQVSESRRAGELPDAAVVDPWTVAGEDAADRPGAPPAEQKQRDHLLRQLLRAAEKILAHLASGADGKNPFDFSP